MINPLFLKKIVLINASGAVNDVQLDGYTPTAICGWVDSQTSKRACIYRARDTSNTSIYFLSTNCANGKHLNKNPYLGSEIVNGVFTLPHCETGIVTSYNGKPLPYYWAMEVRFPPLLEKTVCVREHFLEKFIMLQAKNSTYSDTYIANFMQVVRQKSLYTDISIIPQLSALIYNGTIPLCLASFGHGDLWAKDVFCREDGTYIVIDWEWTTLCAPVGSDLLDFMTAQLRYDEIFAYLMNFLHDQDLSEKTCCILGRALPKQALTFRLKLNLVKFFLFRYLVRYSIQFPAFIKQEIILKKFRPLLSILNKF